MPGQGGFPAQAVIQSEPAGDAEIVLRVKTGQHEAVVRVLAAALGKGAEFPQFKIGEGGAGSVTGESKAAVAGVVVVLIEAVALVPAAEGYAVAPVQPPQVVIEAASLARESGNWIV